MPPADRYIPDLGALLRDSATLDGIGAHILSAGGPRAVRYRETRLTGKSMVFVAHRDDVVRVLTTEKDFSLCHYDPLYSSIAPHGAFLIMRPEGPKRTQRLEILKAAADSTPWFGPDRVHQAARRKLARACVDNVIADIRRRSRFDLIGEYAFLVPYLIAKRVLGLGGTRSFSPLALLICLVNGHPVRQLFSPVTGPYLTDLVWSELVIGQILQNFEDRIWLFREVARSSRSRLLNQFEHYIDTYPRAAADETLLTALWDVRPKFPKIKDAVYRDHVLSIMAELVTTLLVVPGSGFSGIVDRWQAPGGPGFENALQPLETMDREAFVQEQLRLAPPGPHLLRNATGRIQLGELTVEPGEYVCALVKAAGTDIPNAQAVEAGRCPSTYLHFGPVKGPHQCFAHQFAPTVLAEMFLGLTRLPPFDARGAVKSVGGSVPGRLIVYFRDTVAVP
jgi:hypothetical protein